MNRDQKIEHFYNDVESDILNRGHDEFLFSIGKEKEFAACFIINDYDQFEVFLFEYGKKEMFRRYYNIESAALNFAVRITENYHQAVILKDLIISNYKKYFEIHRINLNELYDMIDENSFEELEDMGHYKYSRKSNIIISKIIRELNEELEMLSTEDFPIDMKFSNLVSEYIEMFNKLKSKLNKNRKNKFLLRELFNLTLLAYNCYMEDRKKYINSKEEYLEKEEVENIDSINYESVYRYIRKKLNN